MVPTHIAFVVGVLLAIIACVLAVVVINEGARRNRKDERTDDDVQGFRAVDYTSARFENAATERRAAIRAAEDNVMRNRWNRIEHIRDVLTRAECGIVVHETELLARSDLTRSPSYRPTFDVAIDDLALAKPLVYANIYAKILARMRKVYAFKEDWAHVYDVVVVKSYPGALDTQERIEPFLDNGLLSFVVALNPPSEYEGGELVIDDAVLRSLPAGEARLFCGQRKHHLRPVSKGTRYTLHGLIHNMDRNDIVPLDWS